MGQRVKNIKETRRASTMWVQDGDRATDVRSEGSSELSGGKTDYLIEGGQPRKKQRGKQQKRE